MDELNQQLQMPVGSSFLRVRHVATRESAALVRDLVGHADWVTACAVARDGRRVVSASEDHTLKVWDLATGRAEATLEGHADWVTACAVTPDGRRVVSASKDRTLKVWDLSTERAEVTLEGHTNVVTACAVTPDGPAPASWSRLPPPRPASRPPRRAGSRSPTLPPPPSWSGASSTAALRG